MKTWKYAAIAALLASPVAAEETLTFNLSGTVDTVCGAFAFGADVDGEQDRDFGTLSDSDTATSINAQNAPGTGGSVSYICNSPDGFTRTVASENGGFLFRDGTTGGGANQIAYTVSHGGGSGLGFSATQLSADIITSFPGSPAFLSGQTGGVTFTTNGVFESGAGVPNEGDRTTVFAGTYTDTVTITVIAN